MEIEKDLLPREKISQLGVKSLTNEELLALILGSGSQKCDVFELSRNLSAYLSAANSVPSLEALQKIRGLGKVKASQILACLELSARYMIGETAVDVKNPEDVAARLSYLKYEPQEHFVLMTLDSSNSIVNVHELTMGLVNQTPVHPREAFVKAISDRAVSVIFAHNHPSGNKEISPEDYGITRVLCGAGKIIQIPVIDHIIISKKGHTSICRECPELFEVSK